MNETITVCHGVTMPFFPMRPRTGSPLRTNQQLDSLVDDLHDKRYVIQPKMNGDRACLAVVDGQVWIQNRHGVWYKKPVANAPDFLKLPNKTCFDGEVKDSNFYPFECVADAGRSMVFRPTSEREVVAFQYVKFLKHEWKFKRPSAKFVRQARKNLPQWEGVVLKDYLGFYVMLASETQHSQNWIKRLW